MKKKFKKYYNFTNVIVHDTIYVYAEYEPFTSKIFNFKDVRKIEEHLGYNYMDLKATLYSMNDTMSNKITKAYIVLPNKYTRVDFESLNEVNHILMRYLNNLSFENINYIHMKKTVPNESIITKTTRETFVTLDKLKKLLLNRNDCIIKTTNNYSITLDLKNFNKNNTSIKENFNALSIDALLYGMSNIVIITDDKRDYNKFHKDLLEMTPIIESAIEILEYTALTPTVTIHLSNNDFYETIMVNETISKRFFEDDENIIKINTYRTCF